jgi:anti-repressor protein
MSALAIFEQGGWSVRAIERDGEPLFHHADVCRALEHTNPTVAARMLDDDESVMIDMRDITAGQQALNKDFPSAPGNSVARFVTEPGMYSLIMSSRAPGAKAFQRWVLHTVLPAIRKTGTYGQPRELSRLELLELAIEAEEGRLAAIEAKEAAEEQLAIAAPKLDAYKAFMDADGLLDFGSTAKAIGWGRNTMMKELRKLGILQSNNLPYQRYVHHFDVVLSTYQDRDGQTHPTATTRVKPEGVAWLQQRLSAVSV